MKGLGGAAVGRSLLSKSTDHEVFDGFKFNLGGIYIWIQAEPHTNMSRSTLILITRACKTYHGIEHAPQRASHYVNSLRRATSRS